MIKLNKILEDTITPTELPSLVKNHLPNGEDYKKSIDLCKYDVIGTNLFCKSNRELPRNKMPQLKDITGKKLISEFISYLKEKGYKITKKNVPNKEIKATQNQLDSVKVFSNLDKLLKGEDLERINKPIIISKDYYILDGHHKWAAKNIYDQLKKTTTHSQVYIIDADIMDLIHKLRPDGGFCKKYKCSPRKSMEEME